MSITAPLPGVFKLLQIGPHNTAIFGDALIKVPNFPTMEETLNHLFTSPLASAIFPNVPQASMYFGQMMEKSLEGFSPIKKMVKFKTGNLLNPSENPLIAGGAGAAILGKAGGRGR